jgi:hypothetical protein
MIEIDVTMEDILHGERAQCCKCPIALALSRYYSPESYTVSVYDDVVYVVSRDNGTFLTITLEPKAQEFIRMFDGRQEVLPFTFDFDMRIPSSLDDGRQSDEMPDFEEQNPLVPNPII